nr:MAG TPA: hypothetical protein [Caudoviricetes sp.]
MSNSLYKFHRGMFLVATSLPFLSFFTLNKLSYSLFL